MINTTNEWGALKRIVVGDATHANWPRHDPVFAQESAKTLWKDTPVPSGPVPQWIIDETNEDLQRLSDTLTLLGVKVERPSPLNFQTHDGMYNYCPRDRLLVHGNRVVDCAMMYPCRDMELQCYHDILHNARVLTMPRDQGCVLDAANVCRLDDTLLMLESASGNHKAYEWLSDTFADLTVERCNFYAGVHIDSTVVPLREGLVMLNASRVTEENCPQVFRRWEKIWVDDVVAQNFYQYPYASKWIAMNMLVVDPHTVIVDQRQTELAAVLKKHQFNVVPLELRHSRTLGGGFHCVTLDLIRQ
jgi:scyllo-inosamine-4-phosphate amidinotransferase 1